MRAADASAAAPMPSPSFLDLPIEEGILPFLDVCSTGKLLQTCKLVQKLDDTSTWKTIVDRHWGPFPLPSNSGSWQALARSLELQVRPLFRTSVRRAVKELAGYGCVNWIRCLQCTLQWATLEERRRVVAFVCADWQPETVLRDFLSVIPITGADPEQALRSFLVRFPFLPIDAGEGADRVINIFSESFVAQNPLGLEPLGVRLSNEGTEAEGETVRARDAVYTLTYSIIMLNTDLHNPAISPKIAATEYAASCRRCAPLLDVPDELLRTVYEHVMNKPLAIALANHCTGHGDPRVPTIVRAAASGDDAEHPAIYSIYSAHGPAVKGFRVDFWVAYYNIVDMLRATSVGARLLRLWQASRNLLAVVLCVAAVAATIFFATKAEERDDLRVHDDFRQ